MLYRSIHFLGFIILYLEMYINKLNVCLEMTKRLFIVLLNFCNDCH